SQLPAESWDLFVGILWLRFGSRSGASDPETMKPYESGTEEEFQLAYRSWEKKGRPRILFYRSTRPPLDVTRIDPEQLGRVNAFFGQWEVGGAHPGLYNKYQAPEDFAALVRNHLTDILIAQHKASEERPASLPGKTARTSSPTHRAHGFRNPFIVGRPITDPADFHGRKQELAFILARLATGQSCSIVGDGRSGKTSLLHQVLHLATVEVDASYRPAFVDLLSPATRTLEGLLVEIQSQLGINEPATTLTGFVKQLGDLQSQGRCPLLALDEIDLFVRLPGEFSQDFCETLRASASAAKVVLITASRLSLHELHQRGALVSPLYNILGRKKIGPFTEGEARDFVGAPRPNVSFDDDTRHAILERGDRHPLRLQGYAWH